jgi:hypothetical protein
MHGGWHRDEGDGNDTFVWSDGLQSVLKIPFPTRGDIQMDFEVLPFEFPNAPQQRVMIILNGTEIEERSLRSGRHHYSVTLPGNVLLKPINTLEFRYAYAEAPRNVLSGSPDNRQLSVAWFAIDFTERMP